MNSLSTQVHNPLRHSTASDVGTKMIRIEAGEFLMGSDAGGDFEQPVHPVHLPTYYMDATPVSNAQFAAFTAATGYVSTAEEQGHAWGLGERGFGDVKGMSWRSFATPERDDHPVVMVSWWDAAEFAVWAGKRLPTEAEWEKAARGGLEQADYPWGDSEAATALAGYGRTPCVIPPTSPVGSFPPNPYGLHDMVGTVWQWCADYYDASYYRRSPRGNPTGPDIGELRVRRGAAWNIIQTFRLRCANRGAMHPSTCVSNMGFRCASS
jgi:formylglycine-generating enzyme required for sulfatase activity